MSSAPGPLELLPLDSKEAGVHPQGFAAGLSEGPTVRNKFVNNINLIVQLSKVLNPFKLTCWKLQN